MWPFPKQPTHHSQSSPASTSHSGTSVCVDDLIRNRHSIRGLQVGAKKGVHSLLAGGERSPFKGRGIDFEEVRRYQPGDDVRNMDWRVTARSGEPHLKVFREERERPVFCVVDYTNSMLFGTKVAFKSVVAAHAASLLAWASQHQGDRIGAVVFSNHGHGERRPRGGKSGVLQMFDLLATHHEHARGLEPHTNHDSGQSAFVSGLARVTRTARPGSLIFLLSDFRNMGTESLPYLTRLSSHHDVVNVFIYDQLEQEPPVPGRYSVTNGSNVGVLDSRSLELIQQYRQQFHDRYQSVESFCQQYGMGFFTIGTHESIKDKVFQGLRYIGARRKHIPIPKEIEV